jgi:hypothetical protein
VAKRIADEDDIKQKASKRFAGRRKKEIGSYTSNTRLDIESGESVDYLQAGILDSWRKDFGRTAKFASSVLLNAPIDKTGIGKLLDKVTVALASPPGNGPGAYVRGQLDHPEAEDGRLGARLPKPGHRAKAQVFPAGRQLALNLRMSSAPDPIYRTGPSVRACTVMGHLRLVRIFGRESAGQKVVVALRHRHGYTSLRSRGGFMVPEASFRIRYTAAGRPPSRVVVWPVGSRKSVDVSFRWKLRGSSCAPQTIS